MERQNTWNGSLFTVVEAPLMKLPYSINYHYGGWGRKGNGEWTGHV